MNDSSRNGEQHGGSFDNDPEEPSPVSRQINVATGEKRLESCMDPTGHQVVMSVRYNC